MLETFPTNSELRKSIYLVAETWRNQAPSSTKVIITPHTLWWFAYSFIHFGPVTSISKWQDMVSLCGRLEAQICIRLPFHSNGAMVHPREERQSSSDAVGRNLAMPLEQTGHSGPCFCHVKPAIKTGDLWRFGPFGQSFQWCSRLDTGCAARLGALSPVPCMDCDVHLGKRTWRLWPCNPKVTIGVFWDYFQLSVPPHPHWPYAGKTKLPLQGLHRPGRAEKWRADGGDPLRYAALLLLPPFAKEVEGFRTRVKAARWWWGLERTSWGETWYTKIVETKVGPWVRSFLLLSVWNVQYLYICISTTDDRNGSHLHVCFNLGTTKNVVPLHPFRLLRSKPPPAFLGFCVVISSSSTAVSACRETGWNGWEIGVIQTETEVSSWKIVEKSISIYLGITMHVNHPFLIFYLPLLQLETN